MRRLVLSLFGRQRAAEQPTVSPSAGRRAPVQLPPSVIAAVETATIVVRPGSREDGPRAIVAFPGWPGWTFSSESAAGCFQAGWPDLTPAQVAQASSRLACLVHSHLQQFAAHADLAGGEPARRPYISNY